MKLRGKRTVITGASMGLGRAIARCFAQEGADVLICARNHADLESAREEIAGAFAIQADVAVEQDVQKLVDAGLETMGGVDVLVCNAGVYGPKGPIDDVDWSEWADAVRINLLGTVLCCRLFLPALKQSRRGKIILVSGGGATKPLPYLSAYAASKAALVRFGETLAQELVEARVDVNSIAPGALNTRMLDEIIEAGAERVGQAFYDASLDQKRSGGTPLDTGAALCVFLASDESDGITGKLISAVWDPWPQLPAHRADLEGTDVYTLRRIVPKERGLEWG